MPAHRVLVVLIALITASYAHISEHHTGQTCDRVCECMGHQCFNCAGHEVPNLTMNNLVKTVKATGGIGCVGVFMPEDPGGVDEMVKKGQIAFDFGALWNKGLQLGTGQASVQKYNRNLMSLMNLIHAGKASPSVLISHELPLEQASDGYRNFDKRKDGWTKVVLKLGA